MIRVATAIVVLLSAGAGLAADTELSVARDSNGTYRLHGEFTVLASPAVAWAVLTDYSRLPSFVSSLRTSVVGARQGNSLTVIQHGVGKAGPFTRSLYVTLEVIETEPTRIDFRDVAGRTFKSYSGSWAISEIPGGAHVTYDLLALPRTPPLLFGRTIMASNARDLLDQVRGEVMRRAARTPSEGERP